MRSIKGFKIGDMVQQEGAAPRKVVLAPCKHCGEYVGLLGTTDNTIIALTEWNKHMFNLIREKP